MEGELKILWPSKNKNFITTLRLVGPVRLDKVHIFREDHKIWRNLHVTFDWHYQESRREGWTDARSAVGFCLGSGLFGSYNSD